MGLVYLESITNVPLQYIKYQEKENYKTYKSKEEKKCFLKKRKNEKKMISTIKHLCLSKRLIKQ